MAKKGKPPKPATETGTPRAVSPRGAPAPARPGKPSSARPSSARLPSARPSALLDTRVVYCGDNLEQLAKLPDGCVDLIYIDPAPVSAVEGPFNSNRNYEVFWGETKEKRSFEDRHASTAAYIATMRRSLRRARPRDEEDRQLLLPLRLARLALREGDAACKMFSGDKDGLEMPIKKLKPDAPLLFDASKVAVGAILPISATKSGFRLQYEHPNGYLYQGDCVDWLDSLRPASVDLIVADPPYNINKADWDSFESQEHYIAWSMRWIEKAARALKTTGSLYVCGFSEILADLKHPSSRFFKHCKWLVWHYKNKANLGNDWGRSHESILHLRKSDQFRLNIDAARIPYGNHTLKYPGHPQAVTSNFGNGKKRDDEWTPHPLGAKPKDVLEIPTTCNGMDEKTRHPTQKPEELIRRLVLAASDEGAFVADPFSGSGTTVVVAEQLRRRWMGCDLSAEYNEWAVKRIEGVRRMPTREWVELDRRNAARRESIR